jgi:RES domain-containing protein
MRAYRVTLAAYAGDRAQAFSGQGGLLGMGHWHTVGRPVVYSARSLALAALEALVHLHRSTKIAPYVYFEIEIPDARIEVPDALPEGWRTNVSATQAFGDAWLAGRASVALAVPSAIIPTESNVLINPAHPAFDLSWVLAGPLPFSFDPRLTRP